MTARALQETVARCLAIMAYDHNSGRCSAATDFMESELRQVYLQMLDVLLEPEIVAAIVRPVEDELVVRYGQDVGAGLNEAFLNAFQRLALVT